MGERSYWKGFRQTRSNSPFRFSGATGNGEQKPITTPVCFPGFGKTQSETRFLVGNHSTIHSTMVASRTSIRPKPLLPGRKRDIVAVLSCRPELGKATLPYEQS